MNTKNRRSSAARVQSVPATTDQSLFKALVLLALVALAFISFSPKSQAQSNGYFNQQNSVVLYSECGFRGTARAVAVGDHSKIVNLRFPNDEVSSIRIPQGFEVTIYEDDKFRGAYARLNQDISCFDRSWDDTVSSLKVTANYVNQNGNQYPNQPGIGQGGQLGGPSNPAQLAAVSFSNSQLRRLNASTWNLGDRGQFNGGTNFNVINQDSTSVFLQSTISAERLRVDLAANRVTYYAANGLSQDYPILGKQAGPAMSGGGSRPGFEPNTNIDGPCFVFTASSRGSNASVRFSGTDVFKRFTAGQPVTGRVCRAGTTTMEIMKTSPNTEVTIEIQGKKFMFLKNEKEDQLRNNWYRKFVDLVVSR